MSATLQVSSTSIDLIQTSALTAHLPVEVEDGDAGSEPSVDCALALQLVECAAASMQHLESQLETIST